MNRLIFIILFLSTININAQVFIAYNGEISFFSSTPLEDISAINKKVSSVYDIETKDIVFQLKITDFIFPISLMQEHFNENYLESDIYPTSTFVGKVVKIENNIASVVGDLTIHGVTNKIEANGILQATSEKINISAKFNILLNDYDIDIPKIVMYKIAEEIEIDINIELNKS